MRRRRDKWNEEVQLAVSENKLAFMRWQSEGSEEAHKQYKKNIGRQKKNCNTKTNASKLESILISRRFRLCWIYTPSLTSKNRRKPSSTIGKHMKSVHGLTDVPDLTNQFTILKKCSGKLDCLIYKMLFICKIKPSLNILSDSVKGKIFYYVNNTIFMGFSIIITHSILNV